MGTLEPKAEIWTFGGIRNVVLGFAESLELGCGFSLTRPNDILLSARDSHIMNTEEHEDHRRVSAYLLYKSEQALFRDARRDESIEVFQNGLAAFHIVKPVQTLGFIFQGAKSSSSLNLETTMHRSPADAGQWARMREFDQELFPRVGELIPKVLRVMRGTNAEDKNSIILLQLALEQPHPLIAGLLSVMGMEAKFDSINRNDFKKKLCDCLGPSTLAFPDWNSPEIPPPAYTVEEMAIPIYMLRNKLAHGADLRKASVDKKTPIDLTKKVLLVPDLEPRAHAYLLSEAAIYLLGQVLGKTL